MISDDEYQRRIEALQNNPTIQDAADDLGIDRRALSKWYHKQARKGRLGTRPVLPGFEISRTTTVLSKDGEVHREFITQKPERGDEFVIPEGQRLKRVSANVDGDGNINQQWLITEPDKVDELEVAAKLVEIFNGLKFTVPKISPPKKVVEECLSFFPLGDLHLGLYCWGKELAGENWSLEKADRIYRQTFSDVVSMTPHNHTAVVLFGGDQIHSDSSRNQTPNSGHPLDVDGRYEEVLHVTCEMALHMIVCTLQTHKYVRVRVLKGNHDPHASAALAYFLLASFKGNDRVTIDVSPSLFWVMQWGRVMLCATHGHTVKANKLPGVMAARWAKIWGETNFRFGHSFHVHHIEKFKDEDGGAIVETHHSPAPQDSFNYGGGYLSGRSMKSVVYHKELGEYGGSVRPVMEAE